MNRIKELRKEKNLFQSDVAKILKMSQNGYSQYETEISNITIKNLKALALLFNVNIDYMFYLTNERTPYIPSNVIHIDKGMNRLKEIREDRDLKQIEIAELLNMSQNGYSQYETGICNIPIKKLIKLAIFYNVSIDYLLYLTDERKPHKRVNQ